MADQLLLGGHLWRERRSPSGEERRGKLEDVMGRRFWEKVSQQEWKERERERERERQEGSAA